MAAVSPIPFCLFIQPFHETRKWDPSVYHYEVLIRIRDEKGRILLPGQFMPKAERTKLSTKIDRWVVGSLLTTLAENPIHTSSLELACINVTPETLALVEDAEALVSHTESLLRATKVAPEKICFEIPDKAASIHPVIAKRFAAKLQDIGCQTSLAGFGTGGGSLLVLKNLPLNFVKIDGLFIGGIVNDPYDQEVVRSTQALAKIRHIRTIAERVEIRDQIVKLREMGVDFAQGYVVSQPLPFEDFLAR